MPRDATGRRSSVVSRVRRVRSSYEALLGRSAGRDAVSKTADQGSIPCRPAMGSCGRPHASFATRWSGCDSRRVHHGLVRKVAGLLGREVIRVRFPAGPPGLCVRTRRSLARSARRCDSGQVHEGV